MREGLGEFLLGVLVEILLYGVSFLWRAVLRSILECAVMQPLQSAELVVAAVSLVHGVSRIVVGAEQAQACCGLLAQQLLILMHSREGVKPTVDLRLPRELLALRDALLLQLLDLSLTLSY